jgi:hypothetical protein
MDSRVGKTGRAGTEIGVKAGMLGMEMFGAVNRKLVKLGMV